ncbi:adenosine receptor A2b-like [Branchiostoma lanceolatum]|uniref:adenosine receptor A2b-like n=1 Tax=Branchiostoma lanceolatum TaxID=7740 RepID=UPI0034569B74
MNVSTVNLTGGNSTVFEIFEPCFRWYLENMMDYDLAVAACSHLPDPLLHENRKVGITAAVVGTVALLMNGVVLSTVLKNHQLSKPMYMFVANLAATDCLAGLFSFFLCASFQLELTRPLTVLSIVCTFLLLLVLSAVSVVLLSIDRYLAILHPIFYQTRMSGRHVAVSLGIAWTACVLVCLSPLMGWNCIYVYTENCISVPVGYLILITAIWSMAVVVVVFVNVRIFIVLKRRVSRTRPPENPQADLPAARRREQRIAVRKYHQIKNSLKNHVTVVIIAAVFVAFCLPICISTAQQISCFLERDCENVAKPFWGMVIALCNSAINPVIYALRIKKIREAAHRRARRLTNAVREKLRWSSNDQVVNMQTVGGARAMEAAGPNTDNRTGQMSKWAVSRRPAENPRNTESSNRPSVLSVASPRTAKMPGVNTGSSGEDIE